MKFSNLIKIKLLLISLFATNVVFAVENYEGQSQWTITPRIWLNTMDRASNNLESNTSSTFEAQSAPLAGLSVGFTPSSMENSHFSLTYMTHGASSFNSISHSGSNFEYYTNSAKRTDIELGYRYHFPNSILSLLAGVRVLDMTLTEKGRAPTSTSRVSTFNRDITVYALGVGINMPLFSDSDKHYWFTNILIGSGTYKSSSTGSYVSSSNTSMSTTDINAGYTYVMSDNMSSNIRYRAFTTYVDDLYITMRGPEFSVSYSF